MGRQGTVTEEVAAEMSRRYLADPRETTYSLAAEFGLSPGVVLRALRKAGTTLRPRGRSGAYPIVDSAVGRLREARERAGVSQAGFAAKLGISPQRLCCVERGRKKLTVSLLTAACLELGVSADWVLFGEGSP